MKCAIILGIVTLFSACFNSSSSKTGFEGTQLPAFSLLLGDSTTRFNTGSLEKGKPTVFFYFDMANSYCHEQIMDIILEMNRFKNVRFFVLTAKSFQESKVFYANYHLENFPNVTGGYDYGKFFEQYFKPKSVPYLVVYDSKNQLKKVFTRKVSVDDLEEIVKE
jgi:peroxiredoxin